MMGMIALRAVALVGRGCRPVPGATGVFHSPRAALRAYLITVLEKRGEATDRVQGREEFRASWPLALRSGCSDL